GLEVRAADEILDLVCPCHLRDQVAVGRHIVCYENDPRNAGHAVGMVLQAGAVDFRRVHPLAGEEEGASGFARGESQLEGSLIALAAGVLERPGKGKHLPGGYPGLLEAPM